MMENCENVNDPDPDVTMEKSWIFVNNDVSEIDKGDKGEESKLSDIFNDDAKAVQILSEENLGSPEDTDSDGISVISEEIRVISDIEERGSDRCTCSSTHSDLEPFNNESSEYENDSNTSMLSSCTDISDKLENSCKHNSRRNKIFFFTTVTGLSLVATYLFINAPTIPVRNTADNYADSKIIHNYFKSNIYEKSLCKMSSPLCKLNNSISMLLKSTKNDLESNTKNKDMTAYIVSKSQPNKQVDNFCRVNNKENTQHITNKNNHNIQFENPKHKNALKGNKKMNKDKKWNKNKIVKEYSVNKVKFNERKGNSVSKKFKHLERKTKYLKKLENGIRKLEIKLQKIIKRVKKVMKNIDEPKDKDHKYSGNKSNRYTHANVTGDWYGKMYEGRSDLRHKEKIGDWIFERSNMRSRLRDKARWYFQRSNARENFRCNEKKH